MKIFIGNLGHGMDERAMHALCELYGLVKTVELSVESDAGRSSRFAFVTMPDAAQAIRAIVALNNATLNGRALIANEARPIVNGPSGRLHHRFIRH
jgi:cold-inducible RNA-binding protein